MGAAGVVVPVGSGRLDPISVQKDVGVEVAPGELAHERVAAGGRGAVGQRERADGAPAQVRAQLGGAAAEVVVAVGVPRRRPIEEALGGRARVGLTGYVVVRCRRAGAP